MAEYKTDAVILSQRTFGEADRLLDILSPQEGKLTVIAKGVRRPRSKLAGSTQPFMVCELVLWRGRSLDGIRAASSVADHGPLREELDKLSVASVMAGLTREIATEREPQPELFALLTGFFQLLDTAAGDEPLQYLSGFLARALTVAGFRPVLSRCQRCRRRWPREEESWLFLQQLGGVYCGTCAADLGSGLRLHRPVAVLADRLASLAPDQYDQVPWEHQQLQDVLTFFHHYLLFVLERPLKAWQFLDLAGSDFA